LEKALPFNADCIKAEKIALRLIARAEQSVCGLTTKLQKRGIDPSVAREVVSSLIDKKLLDDERFAECWIRARLGGKKAPSPLWFLVSLEKRGLEMGVSLNAINEILDEETEFSLLLAYVGKIDFRFKKNSGFLKAKLRFERFSPEAIDRFFDSECNF
jgi:regulatory protein